MQDLRSGPLKQVQQCFEGLKDEDNFLEATPSTITVCLKHWFINTNIWVTKKISDECSEILKMVVILIVLKTINNSVVRVARSCNLEARLFQFMAIFSRMYTTPDYYVKYLLKIVNASRLIFSSNKLNWHNLYSLE